MRPLLLTASLTHEARTALTPDAYPGNKHLPFIAAADWLGHDWYVKNKNWQRYPTSLIAKAMDRLALWSNGKPQLVQSRRGQHGRAAAFDHVCQYRPVDAARDLGQFGLALR